MLTGNQIHNTMIKENYKKVQENDIKYIKA